MKQERETTRKLFWIHGLTCPAHGHYFSFFGTLECLISFPERGTPCLETELEIKMASMFYPNVVLGSSKKSESFNRKADETCEARKSFTRPRKVDEGGG